MNEDLFQEAFRACRAIVGNKILVDIEEIDKVINNLRYIPKYNNGKIDFERLKDELLSIYTTTVDTYQILEGRERREPWIKTFQSERQSEWFFWKRYQKYLEEEKNFNLSVISHLDDLTDNVLDKLFNPRRENIEICKKGLVVGQVQSGKTANYTGLICKAADAGFNLIIVLAGIHNNLRSQTQMRIDEGFLGRDTSQGQNNQGNRIGVGKIPEFQDLAAHSYTNSLEDGDFSETLARAAQISFNTSEPIIFVVKKHGTILNNLFGWLETNAQDGKISSKSMLIIDDEADNASINTNKDNEDPTTINKCIRNIVGLFRRSAYVGYTATPFANIFISHNDDDLFPRDFIISLPAPTNYIGPEKIFGTSTTIDGDEAGLPIVNLVNDSQNLANDSIPDSLKTAIKCFIVTCAIRILRGDAMKHNSMLIHISRRTSDQNKIKEQVDNIFKYYKREIEANDPATMEELRKIFEVDTSTYKSYTTISQEIKDSSKFANIDKRIIVHSWEDVKAQLFSAVQKIEVKEINGTSGDALSYQVENGVSVIAIGGDKLSRGLTLEGLSVSYFLRASNNYDTLMQMGRWFGYRPGYVDLCRLFTTSDLNEWYRHITLASEELIEEFKYLAESGGTPDQYALKVRTHPGQLQVTAAGKSRNTNRVRVSWAGRLIETYQLLRDHDIIKKNLNETNILLSQLGNAERKGNDLLWRNIPSEMICDYLQNFRLPSSLKKVPLNEICDYISKLNEVGELNLWSVALMSKGGNAEPRYTFDNGISVGCFIRNRAEDINDINSYYIRKNHILGNQCDEFIDLDDAILGEALEKTKRAKEASGKIWNKPYPSPEIVRKEYRPVANPLLIIYPLNPECSNVKDKSGNVVEGSIQYSVNDEPFIGFAISFPRTETDYAQSYMINADNNIINKIL